MTQSNAPAKRVLVCASCFTDALSALRLLDAGQGLAATEIRGLLISSTVFDDMAGPQGRRVVTPSGALVAAPSGEGARALIEGDAKAFRRSLASMAQSCAASWSFEMRSGELIEGMWTADEGLDVLLVGYRPEHRRKANVVLLAQSGAASGEARALAEALALRLNLEVVSLVCDPEEQPGGHGAPPPLRGLLSRLNRINAEAVVVDVTSAPFKSPEFLRAVLAAARCPLLMIRAPRPPSG